MTNLDFFNAAMLLIAGLGLAAVLMIAATVRIPFAARPEDWVVQIASLFPLPFALALLVSGNLAGTLVASCLTLAAGIAVRSILPRLTMAGALLLVLPPLALLAGTGWLCALLAAHEAPEWLIRLTLAGGLLSLLLAPFSTIERLARQAILTHAEWPGPSTPLPPAKRADQPKVSIHVPAYAEPPEMLMSVLDRLSALDYDNFEVLVCDNNTKDERLWRPVEAHCARLNRETGHERFRFFHVAPLAGAKAGALNFCIERMAPDAELIAVIDADYISRADFLSRLVGFFADSNIAYVQTPHDYRDFAGNPYLTSCYWEYMPSNKVELPGVAAYGAGYTIGTMCIIRSHALREAGGWAEWCLTEDSEVSVRLRALGYRGLYLRDTFGRGLIPETFDDYKKQRFRWTAGPVQQLLRHWRLYRPNMLGGSRHIGGWSKLLETARGVAPLMMILRTVFGLVAAIAGTWMVATGTLPAIDVPNAAWLAGMIGSSAALVSLWHRYRLSDCDSIGDMVRGELARISLTWVQMEAGFAAFTGKPLAWRRTPKFAAGHSGLAALGATLPETVIGLAHFVLLAIPLGMSEALGADLVVATLIGGSLSAGRFLAAPVMALLAERQLAPPEPARLATARAAG